MNDRMGWVATCAVGAVLALGGCSGGDSTGSDAGGAPGAASGAGPRGADAASGDAQGEPVEIVAGFPTNLTPAYPEGRVVSSTTDGTNATLVMQTADPPEKVLAFYESRLSDWKQPVRNRFKQLTTVTFQSPAGGRAVSLVINQDPVTNMSTVSVTAPKYGGGY